MSIEDRVKAALSMRARFSWLKPEIEDKDRCLTPK